MVATAVAGIAPGVIAVPISPRSASMSCGVSVGSTQRISANTPATCGVAIEVPCRLV